MDLDWSNEMIIFESILKQASFFEATGALLKMAKGFGNTAFVT
jgi:hypothetical protein